jgi:predicted metal-dependent hydrolase
VAEVHSQTPQDLSLTHRDRRFNRGKSPAHWWHNENPVGTALYNALSVSFPYGESFFIETLREFRDKVSPKLAAEIGLFIQQEITHSREHVTFNRAVSDGGYDVQPLDETLKARLAVLRDKPAIVRLAFTMGLEHVTAIFSHVVLSDPRQLAGADKEIADMWRWHAVEEIEHKGVAFDTWMHMTKDWSRYKRWKVKSLVMVLTSKNFFFDRIGSMLELLRQDGLSGPKLWLRMFSYIFVSPGLSRKMLPLWLAYFLPGFHPWKHDDRHLMVAYDQPITPRQDAALETVPA